MTNEEIKEIAVIMTARRIADAQFNRFFNVLITVLMLYYVLFKGGSALFLIVALLTSLAVFGLSLEISRNKKILLELLRTKIRASVEDLYPSKD